jgi:pseudomonalisin
MPATKRRLTAAATCLALGALTLQALPASASAPSWAATHTRALHLRGTSLGAAPAAQRLHVSLALPLRNRASMHKLMRAQLTPHSGQFQHFLTPAQVLARFGPSTTTVHAVTRYLSSRGLSGIQVAPNRLLIDASGSVAQVERAFGTHIGLFRVSGRKVYANTTPARVPAALAGKVSAVLGLSDVRMNLPHKLHTNAAAGNPNLSGFTPKQLATVYQATSLPAANNTSVAVVASGDMTSTISHLRYAEKVQGFRQVPVSVEYGAPKAAVVDNNPLTGNAEWDLDVQISTMEASAVKRLYIYDVGTFTDSEVTHAINMFVARKQATTLSASLGECDVLAFVDGAMIASDNALAEGALQGQSMFASTGDNGSFCPEGASTGVPGGGPGDSWPASGEYVTGVGGTTLIADSAGNVTDELAWVGGGGGVSAWEAAPSWTLQANPAGQAWEYNNFGGRGLPDVSADADPNTGVLIYTGTKTPEQIGGTSVSSPLVMGLFARMQGVHANKLGLASYRFYKLYDKINPATVVAGLTPTYVPNPNPQPVPGFTDVVAGSNGLFVAKPGYDYTTGIGTFQTATLSKELSTVH